MTAQELDAAVARGVMGWVKRKVWPGRAVQVWALPNSKGWGEWFVEDKGRCVDCGTEEPGWHPAARIDQAWLVIEKMRELGWTLSLGQAVKLLDPPIPGDGWIATFTRVRDQLTAMGMGCTAPEAICRAALDAGEDTCSNHP